MLAPTSTQLRIAPTVALLLALLALAVPAGASAAASDDSLGFGVAPLRFDLATKPGNTSTHTISITNTESTATKFTFSKEDFHGHRADPGATPVLLGGKFASDISGYDWIAAPDAISIPPGQTRAVPVKVTVPSDAKGAHYAALLVHGESRTVGNVTAQSRLGVLFLMNAGGAPPPEIVITEVREVGPTRTVVEFRNEGKGPTNNTGGTVTKKPRLPGGRTEEIPGKCTPIVLPDAAGECIFDDKDGTTVGDGGGSGNGSFGGVGPVDTSVSIVGDPDQEGTAARGELPTEWAGTWTSMLLPLVGVALFILYFLFLRRRRKQEEDGDVDLDWGAPA